MTALSTREDVVLLVELLCFFPALPSLFLRVLTLPESVGLIGKQLQVQ